VLRAARYGTRVCLRCVSGKGEEDQDSQNSHPPHPHRCQPQPRHVPPPQTWPRCWAAGPKQTGEANAATMNTR
jgi:hypothetical protein